MSNLTPAKSIVVLVSGNGSNLQAILEQISLGKINGKVTAVVSNKQSAYALTRAKEAGIPAIFIDHKSFASRESYDQALKKSIDEFTPDLIVLAGFMRILTPEFVDYYSARMLNIHPSLLPKYKGLDTHQRAIDAGDVEHGASVHFVTPELDGGPVVLQSKVPIFERQDPDELAQRVQQQERQMYPLVISWFCSDRLKMQNNKAMLDDKILAEMGYAFG
ncbi:phosphoribosylglycinamide formyltransferase [Paraglaciecola aquimarina]|uniref:Phosphoribosylglycinamide formyltransferase n=1 Tax=Paraglaciecola aquimarina TaxID=1235557 RepID=A0ABU3SY69_9ALTE|nr:phosphoribosylglycinamide formyltransferase [Paraglaciecola aquimarina]MDU0354955.1 phosphoribosylglycinamide formyltransferase [Paraglaciecola aquimarina]